MVDFAILALSAVFSASAVCHSFRCCPPVLIFLLFLPGFLVSPLRFLAGHQTTADSPLEEDSEEDGVAVRCSGAAGNPFNCRCREALKGDFMNTVIRFQPGNLGECPRVPSRLPGYGNMCCRYLRWCLAGLGL